VLELPADQFSEAFRPTRTVRFRSVPDRSVPFQTVPFRSSPVPFRSRPFRSSDGKLFRQKGRGDRGFCSFFTDFQWQLL